MGGNAAQGRTRNPRVTGGVHSWDVPRPSSEALVFRVPPLRGPGAATVTADTVRDLLRATLTRGHFSDAGLPDEAELQRIFGLSRAAVRRALGMLREEGLVTRVRGAGTFAAARKLKQEEDGLRGLGPQASVTHVLTGRHVQTADALLSRLLEVATGDSVVRLDRQTVAHGQVIGLWTSYLPIDLAGELMRTNIDLSGDYDSALELALGVRIAQAERAVEAVPADSHVAATMRVAIGAPLLRYERVLRTADRVLEFTMGRQRGDRVVITRTDSLG
jgi:GntR family transcriptional regulator